MSQNYIGMFSWCTVVFFFPSLKSLLWKGIIWEHCFSFRVDFIRGQCAWMQTGSYKSCLPCKYKVANLHVYPVHETLYRVVSLQKHVYSNILNTLPTKNENFQIKNSDILHISAQNIDCGYSLELPGWGGSNKYPQSMFLSRNKKNNVYPCKPQFYYIKVGFKGLKII